MNVNSTLFAVILEDVITLQSGEPHVCMAEMYELFPSADKAIQRAELYGKHLLTVDFVYGSPENGKKYTYDSTVDGRYDGEQNEIDQSEWKRVTAGNCEWDIAYSITFKNKGGERRVHVCKWVDFEF